MLEVKNVEVVYNKAITVLRGVSLAVEEGKIVTLLGANGAGKTTTLKAISGLLKGELGEVTRGTVTFESKRIDNREPGEIIDHGIVQVLEGRRIFEHLTVEENLLSARQRTPIKIQVALDSVYEYFPRLKDLRQKTSGYLSGGEQQMLVLGRALIMQPKMMLVDEASLGLAPMLVQQIFEILAKLNRQEKMSILLVEQNAAAALAIAHYGYLMETGRVVLEGTSAALRQNQDVKEFYLGFGRSTEHRGERRLKYYKRRKRWLG